MSMRVSLGSVSDIFGLSGVRFFYDVLGIKKHWSLTRDEEYFKLPESFSYY